MKVISRNTRATLINLSVAFNENDNQARPKTESTRMGEKSTSDRRKTAARGGAATPRAGDPAPLALPTFVPALPKEPAEHCPLEHILFGPPVEPEHRIRGYSEDEFENFIREWAFYHKQIKEKRYVQVGKFGGAGDMGRDVVGYLDPPSTRGQLDIYQCKHYGHPLHPSDVWAELGKLLYYTFKGAFAVPEEYRLVCPEDVGPELGRLLESSENLRRRLIMEWEKHVETEIIKKTSIKLEGELFDDVKGFDFTKIGYKPIHEIIEEHKTTTRYAPRFGGGLIIPRSPDMIPPPDIEAHEQRYVDQLIDAYQDHKGASVTLETLTSHDEFHRHFVRSRERYFCAETLRLDVRDNLPEGVTFEQVQVQVLDAVIDVAESRSHPSGFVRVNVVTDHEGNDVVIDHVLNSYINSKVLKGVCHQLANVDKLKWVLE